MAVPRATRHPSRLIMSPWRFAYAVVEIDSTHRFREVLTVLLSRIETGSPNELVVSETRD